MFAKYWEPGRAKTRLAATIGDDAAAELARLFLETLLLRFQDVADTRVVAFTPPQRREAFSAIAPAAWQLEPQGEGDLGQRMRRFLDGSLRDGAGRVVLIGSDSPTLEASLIQQAFQRLADHDVVLGPSTDGGYYLIGVADRVPDLFEGIAWSTPRVWDQTVERLERIGCRYATLPLWYDVDQQSDLARLCEDLARRSDLSATEMALHRAAIRYADPVA
jgi:rSAM/selenodomain-associated transferase 1